MFVEEKNNKWKEKKNKLQFIINIINIILPKLKFRNQNCNEGSCLQIISLKEKQNLQHKIEKAFSTANSQDMIIPGDPDG